MDSFTELLKQFPAGFRGLLEKLDVDYKEIREIRVRAYRPVTVHYGGREYFLLSDGRLADEGSPGYAISDQDIRNLVEYMAQYSMYAYESELRQGFLTLKGGHRIGIAGKVVMEAGLVRNFQYISSVNIRISHEVKGAADPVLPYVIENGRLHNTLIVSPPGCGKTTLLRDLVRQLSDGSPLARGMNIGVVDERSEIGGAYLGIPQNDVGVRTDLLDCCPKAEGMMMLLRSMSPDVIAVDEIGGSVDVQAIENVLRCGCGLIATIHGGSLEELNSKRELAGFMRDKVFGRYLFLDKKRGVGRVEQIYDRDCRSLYRKE